MRTRPRIAAIAVVILSAVGPASGAVWHFDGPANDCPPVTVRAPAPKSFGTLVIGVPITLRGTNDLTCTDARIMQSSVARSLMRLLKAPKRSARNTTPGAGGYYVTVGGWVILPHPSGGPYRARYVRLGTDIGLIESQWTEGTAYFDVHFMK